MYYGTRGAKNVMYRYSYTGGLFVVGDRSRSYQYNVIYEAMCDARSITRVQKIGWRSVHVVREVPERERRHVVREI